MGVFAEYQPLYARHNIPTFPVQIGPDRKKPATMGYDRVGIPGSCQLAMKFPEIDAFAFMAGKRTRLSVVDIDSPDDDLLRDTLRRYGETRIITRTASGGRHLWYRHNGEGRKIRPEAQVPVDLLGGGVVIAPPSMGARGPYQFERGSLADLDSLQPAQNVIQGPWGKPALLQPVATQLIGAGGRSKALLDYLRKEARACDSFEDLLDVAQTFAAERLDLVNGHRFDESEVTRTAKSVWEWTESQIAKGTYFVGTGKRVILSFDAIDKALALGADAAALYLTLQRRSNHRDELIVANDMRLTMGDGEWTLVRFRKARQALLDAGIIIETKKASTYHGAARYAWS